MQLLRPAALAASLLILAACGGGGGASLPISSAPTVAPSEERLAAIRLMSDERLKECAGIEGLVAGSLMMSWDLHRKAKNKDLVGGIHNLLVDIEAASGGAFRMVAKERWDDATVMQASIDLLKEISAEQEAAGLKAKFKGNDENAIRESKARIVIGTTGRLDVLEGCLAEAGVEYAFGGAKPSAS